MRIDKAQIYRGIRRRLTNRRFLRDSTLLMLANIIVTALALIRTPTITWLIPKEEVGMLGVMTAWLSFIHLLSLPGMDSASYHYIAKGRTWAFAYSLLYRLRWFLLSTLGFCVGALYWFVQGNLGLFWLFIITAITYPVTTGLNSTGNTLAAREHFATLFWYRIGQSLADFAGFLPLLMSIWWLNRMVTFYTANQFATAVLQIGIGWWLLQKFRQTPAAPPTAEEKAELVRYGKHQTALNSISIVRTQTDSFLVSAFFPLTVIADYSLAMLAQTQLKQLWAIYISMRYPRLARMNLALRRRRFVYEGVAVVLGFVAIGFALALAAMWLIPLLLPPSYTDSLPYLNWLILIFVVSMPGFLAEAYFRTEQDEKRQYMMQIIAAVLSVVLPLLLLFQWEIQGLLVGRTLASLAFSLSGIWLFLHPARTTEGEQNS